MTSSDRSVPVSDGSPSFRRHEVLGCTVTHVWFPPRAVLGPHIHEHATLAVVLQGGFDLVLPSEAAPIPCPSGTVLTQPSGTRHANRIGPRGARGLVLQPDVTDARLGDCRTLFDRVLHFRDGPILSRACELTREMAVSDDFTPLALSGLVLQLIADGARLEPRLCGRGRMPAWLRRATEMIHARFREYPAIDEIASEAGVHPAHLAAVFRRFHHQPLASYMRRLRVEWAADRLVENKLPIATIAAEAGFADQAHLTRTFRKFTGTTPAMYRICGGPHARLRHRRL